MTEITSNNFIILGASLDTGNLGVNALLAGTVKCIRRAFPSAGVYLLDGVRKPTPQIVVMANGDRVEIGRIGVRCNKTVWKKNHVLRLLWSALISRILPKTLRKKWLSRNPYLRQIITARAIMDITGGDSFSDIYGMRRLILGSLRKLLVIQCGVDLVLLPQTYGPFKSKLARIVARYVISNASMVYSRDKEGLAEIANLVGYLAMRSKPQFCPDVAFVLDAVKPNRKIVESIEDRKSNGKLVVGFNISGLLYNGGYDWNNMFGLSCDYPSLVGTILRQFLHKKNVVVALVPHVIPQSSLTVESDLNACREVYEKFCQEFPEKILFVDESVDQSEVKYIIGQCEFFIGSRMHACIAAMSQLVPVVGLAYSKKFRGVFESTNTQDSVIDLRECSPEVVCSKIGRLFGRRSDDCRKLAEIIPRIQEMIYQTLHFA